MLEFRYRHRIVETTGTILSCNMLLSFNYNLFYGCIHHNVPLTCIFTQTEKNQRKPVCF